MKAPSSIVTWRISPVIVALAALLPLSAGAAQPTGCEKLIRLKLDSATIGSAGVTGPNFTTPASSLSAIVQVKEPFCRIAGTIEPSSKFEVWLPLPDRWNGKLRGIGNGGMAGGIVYSELKAAVERGYAAVASDLGHQGNSIDGSFAIGAPEKVRDWGYRATHEMTLKAKAILPHFYGKPARRSYFLGCSGGGRQGLIEAQRFPGDYDGILAGDPTIRFTQLTTGGRLWVELAMLRGGRGAGYIPASKLPAIAAAIVAQCDAQDGVQDGVLEDPRQCRFEPASLQCKADDRSDCLTQPQVQALEKIYDGARTSDGRQIYPGYERGGELGPGGWTRYITGDGPFKGGQWTYASGYLQGMVYENPHYDPTTFDFDKDVEAMDKKPILGEPLADVINGANPDLGAFRDHGGKLIVYHGWNDPGVAPRSTVGYYETVARAMPKTQEFFRLFMVPGMQHCLGGPGADAFGGPHQLASPADPEHNAALALEKWVEQGKPPDHLIATKYKNNKVDAGVERTHLLCPYPQSAHFDGRGSGDEAADFECR